MPGISGVRWGGDAAAGLTPGPRPGILAHSYACAFFNWSHDTDYYGRSDIKSAFADLSAKAKAHAKTACRQ